MIDRISPISIREIGKFRFDISLFYCYADFARCSIIVCDARFRHGHPIVIFYLQ